MYSLEEPYQGASNEYPQHDFMEEKEKYFFDIPSYLGISTNSKGPNQTADVQADH